MTGVQVHVGDLLTGRITATIPVLAASWADALNASGTITATIAEDVVRDHDLRQKTFGARSFLAVERDGRVKQAGPIWSRQWDWEKGQLSLGAAGIWSWLDRRVILPEGAGSPLNQNVFNVTGKSLGGIARALVERATDTDYGRVPIVLPADEAGTHTESFPLWSIPWHGEQLRQLTQRATDAPDIAFRPVRRSDDPRRLQWVMQVGTAETPSLSQGGPDWVFDASAPKSTVVGVSTDEDATQMASQVFVTGNGQEENILMSAGVSTELVLKGWPITEAEASHYTVEDQATLNGHASALLGRRARPVEVFKVSVTADAAREVASGDYCRLITASDVWLGATDRRMRVKQVSGDLTDTVTLEMFPMAALV